MLLYGGHFPLFFLTSWQFLFLLFGPAFIFSCFLGNLLREVSNQLLRMNFCDHSWMDVLCCCVSFLFLTPFLLRICSCLFHHLMPIFPLLFVLPFLCRFNYVHFLVHILTFYYTQCALLVYHILSLSMIYWTTNLGTKCNTF